MKYYRSALASPVACVVIVITSLVLPAAGSQIQYSWSGTLLSDGIEDPWQLGSQGLPFELEIVVARDALDLSELSVEFAFHEVDYARLFLDGEAITYVGNGIIEFTDDHGSFFDLVAFVGDFERLGEEIEIGSVVTLPVATFQFSELVEPPPFFGSTENVTESTFGPQGPYGGKVAEGTPVIVVPEAASILLIAINGLSLVAARRCAHVKN